MFKAQLVHRLHDFFIHIRLTVRTIACPEQWETKENKAPVLFVHLQATLRQDVLFCCYRNILIIFTLLTMFLFIAIEFTP